MRSLPAPLSSLPSSPRVPLLQLLSSLSRQPLLTRPSYFSAPHSSPTIITSLVSRRHKHQRSTVKMSNSNNPHGDFKAIEASRPDFDSSTSFHYTKVPSPCWEYGSGPNDQHPKEPKGHVSIDPHEEGRPVRFNYKLLISAIIPRPIAFISTVSKDGKTLNLAPFSYFNFVNHDPPILIVGISSGIANAKDTLKNVLESESAVINIISETFLEAANSTAITAPYGVSEWEVAGLTPSYDCETVKAPRVKEAVFSVEVKLDSVREFDSRATPGKKSGTMLTFEGTRFWVREDAINDEKNLVDPAVLRPISRLGGVTYSRVTEGMELPRLDFEKDFGGHEAYNKLTKGE